jgi:hypothetical protein
MENSGHRHIAHWLIGAIEFLTVAMLKLKPDEMSSITTNKLSEIMQQQGLPFFSCLL